MMNKESYHIIELKDRSMFGLRSANCVIEAIEAEASESSNFILYQSNSAGLLSTEDQHLFLESLLFDELLDEVKNFRKCLKMIGNSSHNFIYVAKGDIFNCFFDLAMTCDARLSFDTASQFGYPMILSGAFPLGGRLEQDLLQNRRILEFWNQTPVRTAQEGIASGFLDLSVKISANCLDEAVRWLELNQEFLQGNRSRKIRKPIFSQVFFRREPKVEYENLRLIRLEAERKSSWPLLQEVLNQKAQLGSDFENMIEELSTRFILDHRFLRSYNLVSWEFHRHFRHGRSLSHDFSVIAIQIDDIIPHSQALLKLTEAQYCLVFWAIDPQALRRRMEILYGRLSKLFSSNTFFEKVWNDQIFWAVGQSNGFQPSLAFEHYRRVSLRRADHAVKAFYSHSSWGDVVEICDIDKKSPNLTDFLNDVGVPIIQTKAVCGLSVTYFLFSRVFEEMIKICIDNRCKFSQVCERLRLDGWEAISQPIEWENFLGARHYLHINFSEDQSLRAVLQLDQMIWDISNLKEANSLIEVSDRAAENIYTTTVSSRICALLSTMQRSLLELQVFRSKSESEIFIARTLGVSKSPRIASFSSEELAEERFEFEYQPVLIAPGISDGGTLI